MHLMLALCFVWPQTSPQMSSNDACATLTEQRFLLGHEFWPTLFDSQQDTERVAAGRVIDLAGEIIVLCCASGAGAVCLASNVASHCCRSKVTKRIQVLVNQPCLRISSPENHLRVRIWSPLNHPRLRIQSSRKLSA